MPASSSSTTDFGAAGTRWMMSRNPPAIRDRWCPPDLRRRSASGLQSRATCRLRGGRPGPPLAIAPAVRDLAITMAEALVCGRLGGALRTNPSRCDRALPRGGKPPRDVRNKSMPSMRSIAFSRSHRTNRRLLRAAHRSRQGCDPPWPTRRAEPLLVGEADSQGPSRPGGHGPSAEAGDLRRAAPGLRFRRRLPAVCARGGRATR